jgi:peptidoglycan/LPS O-acetylase OafA/YrhL
VGGIDGALESSAPLLISMNGEEEKAAFPAPGRDAAERLGHVDTLRAIAALLVVWMHVSEHYFNLSPDTETSRWLYDAAAYVNFGRVGVALFFAISGFVIPFSVRAASPAPAREFLLRRFFRILPLYWFSIPLGAFVGSTIWDRPFPLRYMLVDMTLLQYWLDLPSAMGLYWTLVVEMLFYFCCAFLLFARSLDNYPRLAIIATSLIFAHMGAVLLCRIGYPGQLYLTSLWFLHLGIMFWGTLFRAWHDGKMQSVFAIACTWGLLAFLLVIYPAYCVFIVKYPVGYFVPYVLAIAIFVAGTTLLKIRFRPLARIGEISYSVYLVHPVVLLLMLWALKRTEVTSFWRTRHLATYLLLNMALTIALSAVTYRWIEQPAIAMGRSLSRRWFGASGPVRQPAL